MGGCLYIEAGQMRLQVRACGCVRGEAMSVGERASEKGA